MKLLSVCLITLLFFSPASFSNEKQSEAEIKQLLNDFMSSIKNKDEEKFISLFHHNAVPWIGMAGEKREKDIPSKNGEIYATNMGFISWVAKTPQIIQEKHSDVEIKTDGDIASVYFKYEFYIDDYKLNWGNESMSLIKTVNGWKIISVIYSATYNPNPPS